ncbi:P-loop containing nucleoside triphosphate hydrolase protein [Mycena pura]|uniref:ATP-dependent RNA helicase n=1 Tax=Mycena pura TaxID=153505 RepID=A0AAD6V026_9AGAR|nr:P-loop containing nucleoside triphosphate hydrolase protein [Mycena pura]
MVLWSPASAGWISSSLRALQPAIATRINVSHVLRPSAFKRYYAAAAVELASASKTDPSASFKSLQGKMSQPTLDAITAKPFNLTTMTPVQEAVLSQLPHLAEPYSAETDPEHVRDLMVRARTGTGKTLAFLVPAIEARLKSIEEYLASSSLGTGDMRQAKTRFARRTVGTLIISPTRELATQIANEALKLTTVHGDFEVRLLTGGTSKRMQMRDWMRGRKDIVVATPGRLRDVIESEPDARNALAETGVLVLDEADTLLEMGFREDIEEIKRFLPPTPQRQTLLFSATISKEIQQVARSVLAPNHKFINCVTDASSPVHAHVEQYHTVLPSASAQLPHIVRLIMHDQLTNPGNSKVIVFFPTTKMTQLFATLLNQLAATLLPAGKNTRIFEIHSKRTQEKRTMVSDAFRHAKGGATILVTSDVSARGVDYPGVTRVIQIGIPAGREQYIHRVGRTGRAGTPGRGDLVLLDWEIGFVTWQLTDVPLKPLATNELQDQVRALATTFDQDPQGFFRQKQSNVNQRLFPRAVTPLVEDAQHNIETLLPRLDPEAIRETFMSLLGYYMPKSPELRVQKPVIVQGCQDWATGAGGLPEAPFLSVAFLERLGLSDGRTKHFGKSRYGMPSVSRTSPAPWMQRGSASRAPPAPWMGRGSVRNRGLPREDLQFPTDEPDRGSALEADQYRTQRYRDRGNGYAGRPGEGRGYGAEFRGGFGGRKPSGSFGTGLGYSGGPLGVDRRREAKPRDTMMGELPDRRENYGMRRR